jgi:hypothetical protein
MMGEQQQGSKGASCRALAAAVPTVTLTWPSCAICSRRIIARKGVPQSRLTRPLHPSNGDFALAPWSQIAVARTSPSRGSRPRWMLACAVVLAGCTVEPRIVDAGIPPASGGQVATVGEQSFKVFTFRPAGCAITGILVVLHGVDRNPDAKPGLAA